MLVDGRYKVIEKIESGNLKVIECPIEHPIMQIA